MNNLQNAIMGDVQTERRRQDAKWGPVTDRLDMPTGGDTVNTMFADYAKELVERKALAGTLTWLDILREEVYELSAEADSDWSAQRAEAIQVAAVAVAIVEAGDLRAAQKTKDAARADASESKI